jgi:rubrerythrin
VAVEPQATLVVFVVVCVVVVAGAWMLRAVFREYADVLREASARAANEAQAEATARAEAERAAHLKAMRDAYRAWAYICKAHALTCTRCSKLAYPIPKTENRYACPACGHQFAGAPHPVPLPPTNPDAL